MVVRRLLDRPLVEVIFARPHDPALLPGTALEPIEAGVDEDSHEPHIERQFLSILLNVNEHLDKGVLHDFVGIRRVAQIVIRDAQPAPLKHGDQCAKSLAGRLAVAGDDQRFNLRSEARRSRL